MGGRFSGKEEQVLRGEKWRGTGSGDSFEERRSGDRNHDTLEEERLGVNDHKT